MKCQNCGEEFEGNICPNCNTPSINATEITESDAEARADTEPSAEVLNETEAIQAAPEEGFNKPSQSVNAYTFQDTEPPKPKKKKPMRLIFEIIGGVLLLIFMFASFGKVPKSEYDALQKDYNALQEDYDTLSKANKGNEAELSKLQATKSEYAKYKERMQPYEALDVAEAESRKIEAEKVAADKKAAEEKAAADKKAAEEQAAAAAAAAKAAEEARGYETGITYDQLARTPDDFKGQKVKFYGKVIQVMEDTGTVQIRLAVDDNYDTILLGEYASSTVSSRILEDDYITIYGSSVGTITYQSTMGGNITIPGVYIDKIDQ